MSCNGIRGRGYLEPAIIDLVSVTTSSVWQTICLNCETYYNAVA